MKERLNMNLIEIRGSRHLWAACDEKCYTLGSVPRDCPCGGMNNGVGLEQALLNMPVIIEARIPQAWLDVHIHEFPGHPFIACVIPLWVAADNSQALARAASALQALRAQLP